MAMEIPKTVYIKLTAKEIARVWSSFNNDEQAIFFNTIGSLAEEWEYPFDYQLQGIVDSTLLNDQGRKVMKAIGEYSEQL